MAPRTLSIAHSSIAVCVYSTRSLAAAHASLFQITYLDSPGPHVRHQHDIRVTDQTRMHLWLVLEDVQADGTHLAAVERGDEGVFVDDGSSRRVHDHDAVFHFGEFRVRDYVAGVFL